MKCRSAVDPTSLITTCRRNVQPLFAGSHKQHRISSESWFTGGNSFFSFDRYNLIVGQTKGHHVTKNKRIVKPTAKGGKVSAHTKFIREIVREVTGFAPYERRAMELLKVSLLPDQCVRTELRTKLRVLTVFDRGKKTQLSGVFRLRALLCPLSRNRYLTPLTCSLILGVEGQESPQVLEEATRHSPPRQEEEGGTV